MRIPLTLDPVTLQAFCALATEQARRLDPSWPALVPEGLTVISQWANGWWRELSTPAWHLREEDLDDGPAEAIHIDRWTATAVIGDQRLAVNLERVHVQVHVWATIDPA